MSIAVTPLLRTSLALDAVATGATALLMVAGSTLVAPLTGLPAGLLFWAGLVLVPFVAMVALASRGVTVSRLIMTDIVAINALWVAASVALLVSGAVQPNWLGVAFVLAQAAVVAGFAALQFAAMRRAGAVAA